MASRPWVTPQEVRDYSDKPKIAERTDAKLVIDIARAEQYVISYTNNRFDDDERYPEIPSEVKTAVILMAEMYASTSLEKARGEYKSESFDDYSYTAADTDAKRDNLDLGPLLDDFVIVQSKNAVTMKLRKL